MKCNEYSLVAQTVKSLPAVPEPQVQSVGRKDPLEKEMAIYSSILCLENPIKGGAWQATVHRVTKSQTRLSDFTFNFHFHALEKEMATHSTVLAWRISEIGRAHV